MYGQDDFPIIYVCAQTCAHDDNVSLKTLCRTTAVNFASLTSHIVITTVLCYIDLRVAAPARIPCRFSTKKINNNSKNNNGL